MDPLGSTEHTLGTAGISITFDEKANQRNFMSASITSLLLRSPEGDPELIEAFRTETKPLSAAMSYLMGCYVVNPFLLPTF
jgi:hypothetical protein